MIKANELRIGNYFQKDGDYYQVKSWMDDNYVNYTDNFETTYFDVKDIEPIPLTPEILEKCGYISFGSYYRKPDFTHCEILDNYGEYHLRAEGCIGSIEIKYLHQLQNLYFALTGEELTINLSEPASLSA